jgi:hypothetical protein
MAGADFRERLFRQARRESGLVDFERNCRRIVRGVTGRRTKALSVPGTAERAEFLRLMEAAQRRYQELVAEAKKHGLLT